MRGVVKSPSNFTFHLTCDLDLPVSVNLVSLTGPLPAGSDTCQQDDTNGHRQSAVYAVVQLCDGGEVLGLEMQSRFANTTGAGGCRFGEKLTFCVKYKDLPDSTQLAITVWELAEGKGVLLAGGASMSLFNKRGRLKTGLHKLSLWPGRKADGSSTPGKAPIAERGEIARLENLKKKYQRGDIPRVDWLDKLALREIERIQARRKPGFPEKDSQPLELVIQLPRFYHDVLYQSLSVSHPTLGPHKEELRKGSEERPDANLHQMVMINDPVGQENPVENKAQKLARHVVGGAIDLDLKPDVQERKRLNAVLSLPPNKAVPEDEKVLFWRFRGVLVSEKQALTKFLKCVDWSDAQETQEAEQLMEKWAMIDIADALELLSSDFRNQQVRAHAIGVLERADDEELLSYLLQLVQALRYETTDESQLAEFLATRAAANPRFGFFLHWYLFTEWQDQHFGSRASKIHSLFESKVMKYRHGAMVWDNIRRQIEMVAQLQHINKELRTAGGRADRKTAHLREMLSKNGSCGELATIRVPLPIEPSILLTGLLPQECSVFKSAMSPLRLTFSAEQNDMDVLSLGTTRGQTGARGEVEAVGSSRPQPHCLMEGSKCVLIYKKGDDLRQDQFTVQMFSLMNKLLLKENLDLKLTIYQVLPTSADDGFVEFVQSTSLASILNKHKTIQKFLELHNSDPAEPSKMEEVLNNFVKSCAGYCVMTYILGIGDRHLDNLMLTPDGHLFHIDFGYILGRDPKPLPPPMKLCKEMVEVMGGTSSSHYIAFRTYCSEAYNILRKKANLILSLFHLMEGASIPDMCVDPEKAMLKVQERLALDLDDEGSVQYMLQLINESASALMPQIMEATHRWAQYWK